MKKIKWFKEPEEHNYPAAESYLKLVFSEDEAKSLVNKLKTAKMSEFKAKDIFRASGLSLLGVSNSHVRKNTKKIEKKKKLSPLLLVRDSTNDKLVIADGYHRVCSVYPYDEDAIIPCKIVSR